MDLLNGCDSKAEAKGFLTDPDVREDYRLGNFLVADARSAWHIVWDKETFVKSLDRGSHVITTLTVIPGVDWTERAEKMWVYVEKRKLRAHQLVGRLKPHGVDDLLESLKVISSDHGEEEQSSVCYHDPSGKNIQTSATIITVGLIIADSRIQYCPGNPCKNNFRDYSGIIKKRT